jgi:hypothetical protein
MEPYGQQGVRPSSVCSDGERLLRLQSERPGSGDVVCILLAGRCLSTCGRGGRHNLLVSECYVHGLTGGEEMKILKRGEVAEEVAEEVYLCISWAGFVILFCP